MTHTRTHDQSRAVRQEQLARAERVCSEPFLERHVRPHLQDAPARGGTWTTKVIQLDGSGAATVMVELDGSAPVFAKLFPFDDGPSVYAKLQAFRAAGLGAGQRYQSVEPLAWVDAEKVMLCRGAPGRPVSDLLGGDVAALASATAEAGAWLARLHSAPLRIGAPQSLLVSGEVLSLASRLARVCAKTPDYLDEGLRMLAQLDVLAQDTVDGLLAQSHGQYRPIHVFLDPGAVTVIDLDRSGPADPARDVAEFLHRLRAGVDVATGDISRADEPCRAFLDAYRQSPGGQERLANLRFHWARYLLHMLDRMVKGDPEAHRNGGSTEFRRFRSEFDRVADGRALA